MKYILAVLCLACVLCVMMPADCSAQGYGWRGEYGAYSTPNPYAYQNYGYGFGYGYSPYYGGYIQQNDIGGNYYYNGYAPGYGHFNAQSIRIGNQRQTYFRYGW